jgi:hypothetical protein
MRASRAPPLRSARSRSCHQAEAFRGMHHVIARIALFLMIVPAQAGGEQLIGTWKGPHTFELRLRTVLQNGDGRKALEHME